MAGVTGPTSFYVTPNPFNDVVQLSWAGIVFSGLSIDRSVRYAWRSSPDNATWSAWQGDTVYYTTSGTYTLTVATPSVPNGYYVQYQLYGRGYTSGNVYYSGPTVYFTAQRISYTACGAPTACTVSAAVSEGNVTLSWSGAAAGTSNPISGYEIQYSDSADGASWGGWTALQTVSTTATSGSLSVSPPGTRGYYRRFQVRTMGSAGASYYSGWKASNNLRRNTLPASPTVFTASPSVYQSGNVSLVWSGAAAGTSAIKNYVIQVSTSADANTWSGYSALTTVTTAATSGSYSYAPGTMAAYTRYRICVTDALDCISGYTVSATIRRNSPPPTPTVAAPVNGTVIYNTRPRILVALGAEPDGDKQMLCVKTADGVWQDSVSNPEEFSPGGWLDDNAAVIYRHGTLTFGNKAVSVKAKDDGLSAESGEVSRSFTVAPSPFSEIIPNETPVKAAHIASLRTAVNNVRAYYGLTAYAWSEEVLSGKTQIKNWTYHILEIRKAVEQIVDTINRYGTEAAFPVPAPQWLPIEPGRPSAAVMEQLHGLILSL